jgi:DNA-binding response OmpR family regulator
VVDLGFFFANQKPSSIAGSVGQTRILVVDIDEDVCKVLQELLADIGFGVDCATSGGEARAALAETRYDLIVLDALVPGEPALALADHAARLGLGVVLMSGHPDGMKLSDGSEYLSLHKPFGQAEILEMAMTALSPPTGTSEIPGRIMPTIEW